MNIKLELEEMQDFYQQFPRLKAENVYKQANREIRIEHKMQKLRQFQQNLRFFKHFTDFGHLLTELKNNN